MMLAMMFWFFQEMAGMDHMHMEHMNMGPDELSLFNHHFAGTLLILTAVFGFIEESPLRKYRWARYLWPLPLMVLAIYLLLRSDSEHVSGLALSHILADPEAVQHKLFALLAMGIALLELLRRTGHLKHLAWSYILYTGMVAGGIFLLLHGGHHSMAVHEQHRIMGITAISIGVVKALGDILKNQIWLRSIALPMAMLALGIELVRYYEP